VVKYSTAASGQGEGAQQDGVAVIEAGETVQGFSEQVLVVTLQQGGQRRGPLTGEQPWFLDEFVDRQPGVEELPLGACDGGGDPVDVGVADPA
jgi:hypothetical protein